MATGRNTARNTAKNTGRKRRRPRRRKKQHRLSRILVCIVVEVMVIATLATMIGWDKGVGDWMKQFSRPVVKELDVSGVQSPFLILMQGNSGKIIGEHASEERMYPASLTKMMTALVAIEELEDLDTEITLTEEMFAGLYEQNASMAGFQPGEVVKARDLIYGVILPSGAECCIGLAHYISGSEEAFVERMNQRASEIGMKETHFCDSTGLHHPEHYSTVKDMAVLLKYALRNETFREVIQSPRHSTGVTNVHPDGITYYSTMFKALSDPAVTGGEIKGGKTGYTGEAGQCLASFAEIEGREYILVTGGAPGVPGQSLNILDALKIYNRLGETIHFMEQS